MCPIEQGHKERLFSARGSLWLPKLGNSTATSPGLRPHALGKPRGEGEGGGREGERGRTGREERGRKDEAREGEKEGRGEGWRKEREERMGGEEMGRRDAEGRRDDGKREKEGKRGTKQGCFPCREEQADPACFIV